MTYDEAFDNPLMAFLIAEDFKHPQMGLTFEEIMEMSDQEWETIHNFIQWVFPTMTSSRAVESTPFIAPDDMRQMDSYEFTRIAERVRKARDRYIQFLSNNPQKWLRSHDHNHLRITRMIQSVSLFCGREKAKTVRRAINLMVAKDFPISFTSFEYWQLGVGYGKEMEETHRFVPMVDY